MGSQFGGLPVLYLKDTVVHHCIWEILLSIREGIRSRFALLEPLVVSVALAVSCVFHSGLSRRRAILYYRSVWVGEPTQYVEVTDTESSECAAFQNWNWIEISFRFFVRILPVFRVPKNLIKQKYKKVEWNRNFSAQLGLFLVIENTQELNCKKKINK